MKTSTTFGVTFFTRLNSKKTDNALIFVRITVNGKRSEISLKRNVSQKLWNKNKGKVKGNTPEARALNNCDHPMKKMNYFVYILYSKKRSKYYVGQTADIKKRLKRHNQGLVLSTKSGTPWELILQIEVSTRSEALILERKIKNRGAKRYLNDNQLGV